MNRAATYAAYRPSQVEWLGVVPKHWVTTRLKHIARFTTGWTPPTGDDASFEGENLWANISDLGPRVIDSTAKRISDAAVAASGLPISPRGSLLFSFKLSVGQVSFAARDMYTNEAIATFLPTPFARLDFLYYALPFFVTKNAVENIYGAKLLNQELIKSAPMVLPTDGEQRAIAAFLDRETARIDALIEKKRRLIELLQEKRTALISVAVTKGLDPLASMKDSGETWMGRVPAHWNVAALGYLATVETGATPDRDNAAFWDGDIPWIKTGEIDYRPIRGAEECITQTGLLNSSTRISPPGTLLMAMYGQGTTRGRVALLEVHAAYNQACAAIRFGPRVIGEFGRYFFIAAYDFIRDFGNETSQMNLSASIIRKFRLAVPPRDEQAAIVARLNSETSTIETLVGRVESAVDLLQEQRSAIISAAVTGQIDVREAA